MSDNHYHQFATTLTYPKKCQVAPFEWQNHVEVERSFTEVKCLLHNTGCEVRLSRKDIRECMKDAVTHLTLLATVTQRLLKKTRNYNRARKTSRKRIKSTISNLKSRKAPLRLKDHGERKLKISGKKFANWRLTFGFPIIPM